MKLKYVKPKLTFAEIESFELLASENADDFVGQDVPF